MWNVRGWGVLLVIVAALALLATSATAQIVRPWPDCGKGHFRTNGRTTNNLPARIDVGTSKSVPANTWVQCRTPVYFMKWYAPIKARDGRDTGLTHPEERGTKCLADRCAVIVDMVITASQYHASRVVEGKTYLLDKSMLEGTCGKAANTCRKQAFLGTLTRNESDFAICGGWGGPVNSGDSTGSISVFCSAWMIPLCDHYPQATITTVAQTAEAKSCQRLPPKAPRVPPNERPDHPGEMPQPGTEPVKGAPKPPPTESPCTPEESGGIDVLLEGEFFGSDWASGEVSASASDGSAPETASVGYDYASAGHFGPWECGTTVALTATPGRGSHFDRWVSSEGLCATAVPTCTVPITTTTHQLTAYFAPTIYKLSVVNQQPDGRVTSGSSGGYVNPGIDCGSSPNGSSTEVFSSCTSQAIAQRSDDDVTQLYVSADNPGPGGDTYGVASIDGCDRSVATQNAPVPGGGGTYVPAVQCFIDMNSDRTITVSYTDVGR